MSNIDEIKQRVDIVELISQTTTLKRSGRTFTAPCPFHNERTPSFHVDPARQTWHCFGACSTGGDIFSFIMKKDGCDFREALRTLAERAGVALETHRDTQEDARRARLYEINEAAAAFFQHALAGADGAIARTYLEERRMSAKSVEAFQIGYAPNSWEALTQHLQSRRFDAKDVRASGLAVERERGMYDRFRHRLMFPIRDDRGRVAGFGGRVLPGDAVGAGGDAHAKYVNTSQSPIFDKGSLLYALDLAKEAIRSDGAVIVEGYMDVIAAHEHGFANVVASMGTALTERQVTLLKRYTRNLILALDADAAGSEATLRGVQVVADAADRELTTSVNWRGIVRQQETLAADIRVLTMPDGRDPDDVIRGDPELWRELVQNAKPVLDHLFDSAAARHDLSSPRERSAVSAELAPMIAAVSDRVVQSHYLQRLARMVQVDEATLRLELRAARPARAVPAAAAGAVQNAPTEIPAPRVNVVHDKREEFCIALLIRYPELRAEGLGLSPELFGQSENRALFDAWIEWSYEGESTGRHSAADGTPFEDSLAPELRPQYQRILKLDLPSYDDDALAEALRSSVWRIEQQRLLAEKRARAVTLTDGGDAGVVAERAHAVWQAGGPANDDGDPAAAFVEDMEAGLKIHQRILEQQRNTERPAR